MRHLMSNQVYKVGQFRRLNPKENFEIFNLPENRKSTDRFFLYSFISTAALCIALLGYSFAYYSDLRRINLYDQCGNLCGFENKHYNDVSCSGTDMTESPYLKFEDENWITQNNELILRSRRQCVSDCGFGYTNFGHFCIRTNNSHKPDESIERSNYLKAVASDLSKVWRRIAFALLLTLGVTAIMLLVFRHALDAFVWGSLITNVALWALFAGFSFIKYFYENEQDFLILGIIEVIVVVVLIAMMYFMRKKIKLVSKLLKEATKCVFAMPQLILLPVLFFVLRSIVVILFLITNIYMLSSGTLQPLSKEFYAYNTNIAMLIATAINVVMFIWALEFISGLQYMIVSGAVSKWFFTQNKNNLDGPVWKSASIAMKFHLGTVAFGSMIITLFSLVRIIVKSLTRNRLGRVILDCILRMIEGYIKVLSKHAYIITAMHGKGFWKSGKHAKKLIVQNVVNILGVNWVGDFVLRKAQLLIVVISVLLSYLCFIHADLEHIYAAYIFVVIFAIIIATSVFAVFEATVDSIFICFCEDMLMNDGMAKPYAMPKGLMEFMDESKKELGENKSQIAN